MVKVSVVIPIYNVEKYLGECLESVINQSLEDIEIICVNDGSTDNSLSIIREFMDRDSRVKVIDKANSGYGHSVNMGMDMATGEYIAIVESDDFVDSKMLEDEYLMAKDKDLDVLKTGSRLFVSKDDEYEFTYRQVMRVDNHPLVGKVSSAEEDLRVFDSNVYTWAGIYRREFLNKYGIRHHESPGASFQDNGFWFQTTMYAKRMLCIDKPYYNLRRDNTESSFFKKDVRVICDEYDFIEEKVKESDLSNKEDILKICSYWRFRNYISMLKKNSPEYRFAFWERMKSDLVRIIKDNIIDQEALKKEERAYLEYICNSDKPAPNEIIRYFSEKARNAINCSNRVVVYGESKIIEKIYSWLYLIYQVDMFHRLSKLDDYNELEGDIIVPAFSENRLNEEISMISSRYKAIVLSPEDFLD